ncbi:hypothetical protein Tco_0931637 [Tanacetum coccineum]
MGDSTGVSASLGGKIFSGGKKCQEIKHWGNLINGKSISSEMRPYGSTMLSTRTRKFSISSDRKQLRHATWDSWIEWWKAIEGARVMTMGFEDLVAKLDDNVVMEVLVRCWSDGDVVPTLVPVIWLPFTNRNFDEAQTSEHVEKDSGTRIQACFRDELDIIVEEEDKVWICFLGGNNSLGTKKYQGSNNSDGGNTGDGVKIVGGVIGACGGIGGISSFLEFSEKSEELFPGVAGK